MLCLWGETLASHCPVEVLVDGTLSTNNKIFRPCLFIFLSKEFNRTSNIELFIQVFLLNLYCTGNEDGLMLLKHLGCLDFPNTIGVSFSPATAILSLDPQPPEQSETFTTKTVLFPARKKTPVSSILKILLTHIHLTNLAIS